VGPPTTARGLAVGVTAIPAKRKTRGSVAYSGTNPGTAGNHVAQLRNLLEPPAQQKNEGRHHPMSEQIQAAGFTLNLMFQVCACGRYYDAPVGVFYCCERHKDFFHRRLTAGSQRSRNRTPLPPRPVECLSVAEAWVDLARQGATQRRRPR